jgi:nitric oxide dioxygenase
MAYTLTHLERGLYGARGVRPQTVWRQWEVEKKIQETDDVVTFVVKRIDDHLVKPSLPGQYISVQVPLPDGTRQSRHYSLIGCPASLHVRPIEELEAIGIWNGTQPCDRI